MVFCPTIGLQGGVKVDFHALHFLHSSLWRPSLTSSGALDDSLGPEASSADRGFGIAQAVFFILFQKITASAETAGGEDKIVQSLAICEVARIHPELFQGTVCIIANHVFSGKPGLAMEVTGMGVHQRPAGADVPRPGD